MPSTTPDLIRLSDVVPERVRWIWPGRIPAGKLTIVDGDPGVGKSTLLLFVAARLSIAGHLPDSLPEIPGPIGTVLLTGEDGLADTVSPRLTAMRADSSRIVALRFAVETLEGGGERKRLPTVEDVGCIEHAVRTVEAGLVIIDPLMAHLGLDVNSHRDQDVRSALAGLAELADRLGVAVLCIRHLNKASGGNPLYRGGGSIGLIGAARSGLLVAKDPDDPTGERRILAPTKFNLSAPPRSLAFRLVPTEDGTVRVGWDGESDQTAARLLAVPDQAERTALEEAKAFLREEFRATGQAGSKDLQRRARDAGLAWRTVHRAGDELDVKKQREGYGPDGRWVWRLPYYSPSGTYGVENGPEPPPDKASLVDARVGGTYGGENESSGSDGRNIDAEMGAVGAIPDPDADLDATLGTDP